MAYLSLLPDGDRPLARAIIDILVIAALWSMSLFVYYAMKDQLGLSNGYLDAPFLYSGYYLAFIALAALLFRHRFRAREPSAPSDPLRALASVFDP